MSGPVFANGREISAKKAGDIVLSAMPDVCLSPPSPPAGPVPIPYPNFSRDSDTSAGTRSVFINGKEAGLKNKSNYKKSKGDEAATRTLGMGVVTHTIQGKTKHSAWSSDVKFEGKNVTRHLDLVTINHINPGNSGGVGVKKGKIQIPPGDPDCVKLEKAMAKAMADDTKTGRVNDGQVMATASHRGKIMKSGSESLMKKNIKPSAKAGYCKRPARVPKAGGGTKEPDIACTDMPYNNFTCNSGHAEGKVIQDIFSRLAKPGGTLTIRIRWNDKGVIRQDPCGSCKSAICKTAEYCDLKIELCVLEKGKLKKNSPPCKDGKWKSSKSPGPTTTASTE